MNTAAEPSVLVEQHDGFVPEPTPEHLAHPQAAVSADAVSEAALHVNVANADVARGDVANAADTEAPVPSLAVGETAPSLAVGETAPSLAVGETAPSLAVGETAPSLAVGETAPSANCGDTEEVAEATTTQVAAASKLHGTAVAVEFVAVSSFDALVSSTAVAAPAPRTSPVVLGARILARDVALLRNLCQRRNTPFPRTETNLALRSYTEQPSAQTLLSALLALRELLDRHVTGAPLARMRKQSVERALSAVRHTGSTGDTLVAALQHTVVDDKASARLLALASLVGTYEELEARAQLEHDALRKKLGMTAGI